MDNLNIPEVEPIAPVNEKPNWTTFVLVLLVGVMIGGMFFAMLIFSGQLTTFMTDGQCDDMFMNVRNVSFQEGAVYGSQIMQQSIIIQGVECELIPFEYQNNTLNFIVVECLNLGEQNG